MGILLKKVCFCGVLGCSLSLFAQGEELSPGSEEIQIIAVEPSPENDDARLTIELPPNGSVEPSSHVRVQMKMEGFALGVDSDLPREHEIANSSEGQTIHVFIDREPYIPVKGVPIDPYNEDQDYYDSSVKFEIPYSLSPGMHILRAFPCRSFGESLKGRGCFKTTLFYVQHTTLSMIYLLAPLLLYNEPSGNFLLKEGDPILLDFYIANCELSEDGFRVRMTLDGKTSRTFTKWTPYYIYGLKKGYHTISMDLLDPKGELSSPTNRVEGRFLVE